MSATLLWTAGITFAWAALRIVQGFKYRFDKGVGALGAASGYALLATTCFAAAYMTSEHLTVLGAEMLNALSLATGAVQGVALVMAQTAGEASSIGLAGLAVGAAFAHGLATLGACVAADVAFLLGA